MNSGKKANQSLSARKIEEGKRRHKMTEEALLNEIMAAPQRKRDAILSYAYFVLHGETSFPSGADANNTKYIPFQNYEEVDGFLDFHQRQTGLL